MTLVFVVSWQASHQNSTSVLSCHSGVQTSSIPPSTCFPAFLLSLPPFFFFFKYKIGFSSGWPQTHQVVEAGLELLIFQPLTKNWVLVLCQMLTLQFCPYNSTLGYCPHAYNLTWIVIKAFMEPCVEKAGSIGTWCITQTLTYSDLTLGENETSQITVL